MRHHFFFLFDFLFAPERYSERMSRVFVGRVVLEDAEEGAFVVELVLVVLFVVAEDIAEFLALFVPLI